MTVISFADFTAHPEQIGVVLKRVLANQASEVVWVTLDESLHWKVSYCPMSKIAECHHKGGDNFILIARISDANTEPKIDTNMKLVRLSNYEIDESGEEPDELTLHLDTLTGFLPKILEIEQQLPSLTEG